MNLDELLAQLPQEALLEIVKQAYYAADPDTKRHLDLVIGNIAKKATK